ncbi:NUDIX domain protein [Pseudoruegeria aquimaris]|uniref:NUDIX domain protein n=1 Tax=Pseudoruegeria aquimaris TaxID=393663 RepID=A0A1Y5RPR8_9RHOB|nr:NUDIX hydrolase [Pseudoruegeria aquimaris]SLN22492.1 NUDIX domain protein [Pseudoruegeria aquimaris]
MNKKKQDKLKKAGKGRQVAALPVRWRKDGKLEILLVTSRDTGRWVLPKGWTMEGKSPWKAAAIEAEEEAGAEGKVLREPLGSFRYEKRLDDGTRVPTKVKVYPLLVEDLAERWKERGERKRKWFTAKEAARHVKEEELSALFRELRRKPKVQKTLRKAARKK